MWGILRHVLCRGQFCDVIATHYKSIFTESFDGQNLSRFEVFRFAQGKPSVRIDGRHIADFLVPPGFVGQLTLCLSVAIPSRLISVARVAQILRSKKQKQSVKNRFETIQTYSDPVERFEKDVMREPHQD